MNSINVSSNRLAAESLFHPYRPLEGVYDEMFSSDGDLRPECREFAELVDGVGAAEIERRWEQASRLIHEDGVTYNIHGEKGRDPRWDLDALPLVVRSAEWAGLSEGLAQRARLLNAIAVDIYGPQHTLREGLLPAELVWDNPSFLRPCHGWSVPLDRYLYFYAAHLARSPEGSWWVVADRTQAPLGAGYAVENRIAISRMLPHLFAQCNIQRLAGFFIALRETLRDAVPGLRGSPHTVLLTPGPKSPSYFEDAYLARYLGYTLVEAEDLTVRDDHVFLKTLGGLNDVDVVLRRIHDRECDPLELDSQSASGVAGLTHAARRGNVVLANALGSAVLEMPALMAFLPALARRLLGEDLKIPSVQTWWCGQEDSLAFVLANLERLVIQPAAPDPSVRPIAGASLSKADQYVLKARVKADPARFVAQELIVRSTTPVWSEGNLRAGHIALRTFVAAAGDSYRVMPGALAHVSSSSHALGESMFVGQGSKDVWVQSDGPVAAVTLLRPPGAPIAPRRSGNDLPSRVADNLFWLGRHVERAEGAARLLRSILTRMASESGSSGPDELSGLFRALTCQWPDPSDAYQLEPGQAVSELQVLSFLYDPRHPGSLQTILTALGRAASIVRDRISLDSWRILRRLDDDFHPGYPLGVVSLADVLPMLNQMVLNLSAFNGVAMENMTRGPGWQFLDLGRRIERAIFMIGLLRNTLFIPTPNEHAVLETLLEIADSSMTYRNRYATHLQLAPLLDLLMIDESNPRSVAYQLAALARHVEQIQQQQPHPVFSDEQRLVMSVLGLVRLAEVASLGETGAHGTRAALDDLLATASTQLGALAGIISHKYLVHAGPPRQMTEIYPSHARRITSNA